MSSTPSNPLALPAGDLRDIVTFYVRSVAQESTTRLNEPTYTTYSTSRAKIEPMHGTELVRSGVDVTQNFITVTMRYRSDIDSTMRLGVPNGSVFTIQAIENVLERNRVLKLTCLGVGPND